MRSQSHFNQMSPGDCVGRRSDADLLGDLIGVQESRKQYRGSLKPFFADGETRSHTKCAVARELVRRWLSEELRRVAVLAQPTAVTDYLKIHFAGREYESFVVLYLDAQNRLIDVEELFRGSRWSAWIPAAKARQADG